MIIRPATESDSAGLAEILNRIIARGGTTAHLTPFDAERMSRHYIAPRDHICCYVAVSDQTHLGFQSLVWPDPAQGEMPTGWSFIASFVDQPHAGKGVGKALFAQTLIAAKATGVSVMDATIRADNEEGLRFYASLGFVDYQRLPNVPLSNGVLVDRICKKYAL